MKKFIILTVLLASLNLWSQPERWQQRVEYKIDVSLDHVNHQLDGKEQITYFNNSPELLKKAFFHLYYNAFQPGSAMDIKSLNIKDPDPRVSDRISKLTPDKIGNQMIKSISNNGKPCTFKIEGTILEVDLPSGIKPKSTSKFEIVFKSQIPEQIRRTGRNNKEGIDYSMTQWYPKMCEYDVQGWHSHPYVGREFYGVWGDFEVNIDIDSKYIIGGTGYLQNADEIGCGYSSKSTVTNPKSRRIWKFKAYNVHDFAWAADPDYKHITRISPDNTTLHFLYQPSVENDKNWASMADILAKTFPYINKTFGQYPYKSFTVIQGGDGGMEYPMSTLVTGNRPFTSLLGTVIHEGMHSWYYGVLGSNESLYPWMDEGFTTYAETMIENYIRAEGWIPGESSNSNPMSENIDSYIDFTKRGIEEPLSTHADHYLTNTAYSVASYVKGSVFLHQLSYIIGKENFDKALLEYYNIWKFKHPNPNDVIRIFEKTSNLELDWYKEYMVNSLHQIDYGIQEVRDTAGNTMIQLAKLGKFPFPLDILVSYKNGKSEWIYIPLDLMRGEKPKEDNLDRKLFPDWQWINPTYSFELKDKIENIKDIVIDPKKRTADIDRSNNVWTGK